MKTILPPSLRKALLTALVASTSFASTVKATNIEYVFTGNSQSLIDQSAWVYLDEQQWKKAFSPSSLNEPGGVGGWGGATSNVGTNNVMRFVTASTYASLVAEGKAGGVTETMGVYKGTNAVAYGNFSLGGITVDAGATGHSYSASNSMWDRSMRWYGVNSYDPTSAATFNLAENFTISLEGGYEVGCHRIYMEADADINVASQKTFSIIGNITDSGIARTISLSGGGTLSYKKISSEKEAIGSLASTWSISGSTLDLSSNTVALSKEALGSGEIQLSKAGVVKLSAGAHSISNLVAAGVGGGSFTGATSLSFTGGFSFLGTDADSWGSISLGSLDFSLGERTTFFFNPELESGTYTLLTYNGSKSFDTGSFELSGIDVMRLGSWNVANGSLSITIIGEALKDVTWGDSGTGLWKHGEAGNWQRSSDGSEATFYNADRVSFADASAKQTVTIEGLVNPSELVISAGSYTFASSKEAGEHGISGESALQITGGSVSMNTQYLATGGINVSLGASLTLNAEGSLGTAEIWSFGTITLNDSSLTNSFYNGGKLILNGESQVSLTQYQMMAGSSYEMNGGILEMGTADRTIHNGNFHRDVTGKGGKVVAWLAGNTSDSGGGNYDSVALTGLANYQGVLEIRSGLLNVNEQNAYSVANLDHISLKGGGITSLDSLMTFAQNIDVAADSTGYIRLWDGGQLTLTGAVTGKGNLTRTDSGYLTFASAINLAGNFTAAGGITSFNGGGTIGGTLAINMECAVYLIDDISVGTVAFRGREATLAALGKDVTMKGNVVDSLGISAVRLGVANGSTLTIDGNLSLTTNNAHQLELHSDVVVTGTFNARVGSAHYTHLRIANGKTMTVGTLEQTNAGCLYIGGNVANDNAGGTLIVKEVGTFNAQAVNAVTISNGASLIFDLKAEETSFNHTISTLAGGEKAGYLRKTGTGSLTLSRVISESTTEGVVNKLAVAVDNGSLTLSAANTYSGGTSVEGGTLFATVGGALGSGAVSIAEKGTLSLTGAHNNSIANSGVLLLNDADITAASVSYANGATLHLTGENYSADISIARASSLVLQGGGTLHANLASAATTGTNTTSFILGKGGVSIGSDHALILNHNVFLLTDGADARTITGNVEYITTNNGVAYIGNETKPGAITIDGHLTRTEGNLNYGSELRVRTDLTVTGTYDLGSSDGNSKAARLSVAEGCVFTVGELQRSGTAGSLVLGYTDGNSGTFVVKSISSDFKVSSIALNNGATFMLDLEASSTTLSKSISGNGQLVKAGAGSLTISGNNSSFTGTTSVSAGTLVVGHENAFGSGSVAVHGGTLDLGTYSIVNTLSGKGIITAAGNLTLGKLAVDATLSFTDSSNAGITLSFTGVDFSKVSGVSLGSIIATAGAGVTFDYSGESYVSADERYLWTTVLEDGHIKLGGYKEFHYSTETVSEITAENVVLGDRYEGPSLDTSFNNDVTFMVNVSVAEGTKVEFKEGLILDSDKSLSTGAIVMTGGTLSKACLDNSEANPGIIGGEGAAIANSHILVREDASLSETSFSNTEIVLAEGKTASLESVNLGAGKASSSMSAGNIQVTGGVISEAELSSQGFSGAAGSSLDGVAMTFAEGSEVSISNAHLRNGASITVVEADNVGRMSSMSLTAGYTAVSGSLDETSFLNGGQLGVDATGTLGFTGGIALNAIEFTSLTYDIQGLTEVGSQAIFSSTGSISIGDLEGKSNGITGGASGYIYTWGLDDTTGDLMINISASELSVIAVSFEGGTWTFTLSTSEYNIFDASSFSGNLAFTEGALVDFEGIKASGTVPEWITSYRVSDGDESKLGFNEDHAEHVSLNGVKYASGQGYRVAYIPEPSTVTMSLLAFVGLAARRRRKA